MKKCITFTSRTKVHNEVRYKNYLLAPIDNKFYLYELNPKTGKIAKPYLVEFDEFETLFECFNYIRDYYRVVSHRIVITNKDDILEDFV